MKLVNLSERIKRFYINNTNMHDSHLFKDGIHVSEFNEVIFANNFNFCLNNVLMKMSQPTTFTQKTQAKLFLILFLIYS